MVLRESSNADTAFFPFLYSSFKSATVGPLVLETADWVLSHLRPFSGQAADVALHCPTANCRSGQARSALSGHFWSGLWSYLSCRVRSAFSGHIWALQIGYLWHSRSAFSIAGLWTKDI